MSKRPIDSIVETEIEARFSPHAPSKNDTEVAVIKRLLNEKLKTVYDDFLIGISIGSIGRYMIEGKMGELRKKYYKKFYEPMLIENFVIHFVKLCSILRVKFPNEYYTLMSDIFPIIYQKFLSGDAFIGSSYITHTPMISFVDPYLFVIKTVRSTQAERNVNGKRRLMRYEFKPYSSTFDKGRYIYPLLDCDMIGVVSGTRTTICFDSNNIVYQMYNGQFDFYESDLHVMKTNLENIIIKALFGGQIDNGTSEVFFLLTVEGSVLVKGRCGRLIKDYDENNPIETVVDQFTPVVGLEEENKKIVDIIVSNLKITFIDEHNKTYIYNYFTDSNGIESSYTFPTNEESFNRIFSKTYKENLILTEQWGNSSEFTHSNPYDDRRFTKSDITGAYPFKFGLENPDKVLLHYATIGGDGQTTDYVHIVLTLGSAIYFFLTKDVFGILGEAKTIKVILKHDAKLYPSSLLQFQSCSHCQKQLSSILYDKCQHETFCTETCQSSYYNETIQYLLGLSSSSSCV